MLSNITNKEYCVGFAFYKDKVVLIKKNRPDFQKGKLNGIGGSLEGDEDPVSAMVREFKEETGISTSIRNWNEVGKLDEPKLDVTVYCFYSFIYKYEYDTIVKNINNGVCLSKDEPLVVVDIYKELEQLHKEGKTLYNILDIIRDITKRIYPRLKVLDSSIPFVKRLT